MTTLTLNVTQDNEQSASGEYVLARGSSAARRLFVLHKIYGPAGRRLLLNAGLKRGMCVADFGCGVGATSCMLADLVGESGTVTGIDLSVAQLEEAQAACEKAGLTNVAFQNADACASGLPSNCFDLVYCRFLLLHLTDPTACLYEMQRVLKPGGILVIEDGDIASAGSVPSTALNVGVTFFMRLGAAHGLNYSLANNLYHLVKQAGFAEPQIEIHQPAGCQSEHGDLLTATIAEAGPAFLAAGLLTPREFSALVLRMRAAAEDPKILVLAPRMSVVWSRKSSN